MVLSPVTIHAVLCLLVTTYLNGAWALIHTCLSVLKEVEADELACSASYSHTHLFSGKWKDTKEIIHTHQPPPFWGPFITFFLKHNKIVCLSENKNEIIEVLSSQYINPSLGNLSIKCFAFFTLWCIFCTCFSPQYFEKKTIPSTR